ncbi:MAG: WecB/TagA/CpsF family glycosyltransferase [Deltaproteobacteria bacterium]|nr:WecB/TagA/CpsF family glycosyltransferase [Deltaproteobacteria bacterium]
MNKTPFLNTHINILNTSEALAICSGFFDSNEKHSIFFLNAHCFNVAQKDDQYLALLKNAGIVLNDGIGVHMASKFLGISLKENMNGSDFIPKLIKHACSLGKKVFLLGSEVGVAERAKNNLERKLGDHCISGVNHGYILDETENRAVLDGINKSEAELLVVCMGVPLQEKWIERNLDLLENIKIAVAGGAIIDFLAGKVKRAPTLVQKLGIEWLYRFGQEPNRLFRRYFIGNIVFFFHVFRLRRQL